MDWIGVQKDFNVFENKFVLKKGMQFYWSILPLNDVLIGILVPFIWIAIMYILHKAEIHKKICKNPPVLVNVVETCVQKTKKTLNLNRGQVQVYDT